MVSALLCPLLLLSGVGDEAIEGGQIGGFHPAPLFSERQGALGVWGVPSCADQSKGGGVVIAVSENGRHNVTE